MATTSKKIYTEIELDWAEQQLHSWREYIDAHPMHELEDRVKCKEMRNGGTLPVVISTIEQQGKYIQETLKNYLLLLKEVDIQREKEVAKQTAAKGENEIPYRMQKIKENGG